jgi:hypothetical protein
VTTSASLSLAHHAVTITAAAVDHLRALTTTNPDAYLPDLAASLNTLSVRLGEAGRREQGLTAIEEAVAAYRELAEGNRDAYLPNLDQSLRVHAWIADQLGNADSATTLSAEADRLTSAAERPQRLDDN